MDYPQAYAEIFANFVEIHNLDLDSQYWPEELKREWKSIFNEFQLTWERVDLLAESSATED